MALSTQDKDENNAFLNFEDDEESENNEAKKQSRRFNSTTSQKGQSLDRSITFATVAHEAL